MWTLSQLVRKDYNNPTFVRVNRHCHSLVVSESTFFFKTTASTTIVVNQHIT